MEAPHLLQCYTRTGHIILIPKKDADSEDPGTFRPITLLNTDLKILELLILKRLKGVPRFSQWQTGFREHHRGTTRQHLVLRTISDDAKTSKKRQYVALMDLSKAFDSISIELAVQQLISLSKHESGRLVRLACALTLQERKACITGSDGEGMYCTSDFEIQRGTPQGVLPPFLFILFMETVNASIDERSGGYVMQHFQGNIPYLGYADDLAIIDRQLQRMQKRLQALGEWALSWDGKFNAAKCELIPTGNYLKAPKQSLSIQGESIPFATRGIYLGREIGGRRKNYFVIDSRAIGKAVQHIRCSSIYGTESQRNSFWSSYVPWDGPNPSTWRRYTSLTPSNSLWPTGAHSGKHSIHWKGHHGTSYSGNVACCTIQSGGS